MNLRIEDKICEIKELVCRELGFGEEIPAEKRLKFEMEIEVDEVPSAFIDLFNRFIEELREDDILYGSSLAIEEVVESRYAPFATMASDYPRSLCSILARNLPQEFLWSVLGGIDYRRVRYSINVINDVNLDRGILIFRGVAFPVQASSGDSI